MVQRDIDAGLRDRIEKRFVADLRSYMDEKEAMEICGLFEYYFDGSSAAAAVTCLLNHLFLRSGRNISRLGRIQRSAEILKEFDQF